MPATVTHAYVPWKTVSVQRIPQVDRRCVPDGTCERGAAAWERLRVVPLSRMQSGARARGSGHARPTVPSKTISALGACTVERTGPCQREQAKPRSCAIPRASACEAQDAVTVIRTVALLLAPPGWSGPPVRSQREEILGPSERWSDGTGGPRGRGVRVSPTTSTIAGDYPWFGFRAFGGFCNSAPSCSSYHSTVSIVLGHSSP